MKAIARTFPVLLAVVIASADAAAADVDPAAFACNLAAQASVRDRTTFQTESASITGDAVTVRYRVGDERGELRCAFKLDENGAWIFDVASPPELVRCDGVDAVVQKLIQAGEIKAARHVAPEAERCLAIRKTHFTRLTNYLLAAASTLRDGAYPIARAKTTLTTR